VAALWVITFKAESHEVPGTPSWSSDTQGTRRVHQTVCLLPETSAFEVAVYTGETTTHESRVGCWEQPRHCSEELCFAWGDLSWKGETVQLLVSLYGITF